MHRLSRASVLTITAALLPFIAIVAPLGTAPLLAIVTLALVTARLREGEGFDVFRSIPSALLFVLVLWAAVTLAWTPDPARGARTVVKLALTFAGGLLLLDSARKLTPAERMTCGKVLAAGTAVAIVYLAIDLYGDGVIRGSIHEALELPKFWPYLLNRTMTIAVLLLWPALMVVARHYGRRAAWIGLAAAMAMLAGSESAAALVGLTAGAIVFGLAAMPRVLPVLRIVTTAGAVLSVFAVLLFAGKADRIDSWRTDSAVENSLVHRLFIWDFVASHAVQRPWSGWGIESSRSLGGKPVDYGRLSGESSVTAKKRAFRLLSLPLHPHNGELQVWLELGVVGALLLAGFVGWVFWTAGDRTRWSDASGFILAHAVTGYAIVSSSYGIWQSWWLCTLWLSAAMAVAVAPLASGKE